MKLLGKICPHCNKRYWLQTDGNMCERCYYGCGFFGTPPRPLDIYPLAALSNRELLEMMREAEERERVSRCIASLET